jgi:hypothetical protein
MNQKDVDSSQFFVIDALTASEAFRVTTGMEA